eukprot:157176-Pyramimonas_sp.AAC.1
MGGAWFGRFCLGRPQNLPGLGPGLAWCGSAGRRKPPETSSEFAWFGPGLGEISLEKSLQFA